MKLDLSTFLLLDETVVDLKILEKNGIQSLIPSITFSFKLLNNPLEVKVVEVSQYGPDYFEDFIIFISSMAVDVGVYRRNITSFHDSNNISLSKSEKEIQAECLNMQMTRIPGFEDHQTYCRDAITKTVLLIKQYVDG